MPTPNWTKAIIALFAATIFLIALLTGQSIDQNGWRWVSAAATGVVLVLLVYEKWAWRWPLIRLAAEWAGRPVIHGTWKGELHYERDAKDEPGSIPIYVAVVQTFSTVRVRSYVSTSESYSLVAVIERPVPTQRQLVFAYRSEAPHAERDSNRPHDGTCILSIVGIPVEEMIGSYYTDRLRRGSITLAEHCGRLAESFGQAERQSYRRTAR